MQHPVADLIHAFVNALSPVGLVSVVILMLVNVAAGLSLQVVVRRARRDDPAARGISGLSWDLRMLSRSFYPLSGRHLYPTIIRLYLVSVFAMLIVFAILVRQVVLR